MINTMGLVRAGLAGRLIVAPGALLGASNQRRSANTKPWNEGPKEDWKKGIYNYEYRRLRGRKFTKVELPDFDAIRKHETGNMTPEEVRSEMKKNGMVPHRSWNERPIFMACTPQIVDPFSEANPTELEMRDPSLAARLKGKLKKTKEFIDIAVPFIGKSRRALKEIKRFLPDIDPPTLSEELLQIYIKAHKALADEDEEVLHDLVTERCYPEMVHQTYLRTIRWKFIKSLTAASGVLYRTGHGIVKEDMFAQMTVKFHTQQILAVYDRFGRLIYGSEAVIKDVLEYVVFEHHIADRYGKWRIHGKILPDSAVQTPIRRTFVQEEMEPEPDVFTETKHEDTTPEVNKI